jgi:hypothetical protein
MSVIHMEGDALKIDHKEAEANLEKNRWRKRDVESLVGTLQGQMEEKFQLIEEMKNRGDDVGRELIKLEMVQEQLASQEKKLSEAKIQLHLADTAMISLTQKIQCHQL